MCFHILHMHTSHILMSTLQYRINTSGEGDGIENVKSIYLHYVRMKTYWELFFQINFCLQIRDNNSFLPLECHRRWLHATYPEDQRKQDFSEA